MTLDYEASSKQIRDTVADLRLRIAAARENLATTAPQIQKVKKEETSITIEQSVLTVEDTTKENKRKELSDMKAKLKGFKK